MTDETIPSETSETPHADADESIAGRLRTVREAIQAILRTGQSYQVGSRKLTRADLGMLRQLEKDLEDELDAEDIVPGLLRHTGRAVFGRR